MLAHDVDASVVGGIELKDLLAVALGAIYLSGKGEDCGGFSSTRRAIEEEMRKTLAKVVNY